MELTTILFIAFGLSMDAFAVSITNGMMLKRTRVEDALRVGLFFGIAQGIMPLLGWLTARRFSASIERFDHWIALILLSVIGINMIWESIKCKDDEEYLEIYGDCETVGECEIDNKTLFLLAIATSIDALAVGVNFAFLRVDIMLPIIAIGLITAANCFVGVFIGEKCGTRFRNYAEIIGGIILILIGLNIFIEHTLG